MPALPPREVGGGGAGGGGEAADRLAFERQQQRRAKLAAHFPDGNRSPSAGGGDGASISAAAAAARPRSSGRPVHPARLGASPTRKPAPFTSPAELVASTRGSEHEGDVINSTTTPVGGGREGGGGSGRGSSEMTIERRRFGGVERRTVQVRGGGASGPANRNDVTGHNDNNNDYDDDDDNYTTVKIKGVTLPATTKSPPSPASSASPTTDVEHPVGGRRRSCTPTIGRPAADPEGQRLASNLDHDQRRRASTPTRMERSGGQRQISPIKERLNRKTAGIGKVIRGGANKLFASSGGGSASTSVGTPLSSSGGSSAGRRGLGSLDNSNTGARTRLGGRFFSNPKGGGGGGGGVEDFSSAVDGAGPYGAGKSPTGYKSSPGH